jgi:hypothetical protein
MRILNFLNSNNNKQKSIRIKTEIGDKFINVNLDQTYESLDVLSLKIFQKDIYRLFDADYGVIVGRVNSKNVGIPNCRVSVFISIDEDTVTNPTTLEDIKKIEAAAIYPYETVYDKDAQGKIYNLLPKYSKNRNINEFPDNDYGIGATPKTPVGTFPEKEEVLINETVAYVYDKYYKYSTTTNESGDYILIVPSNRTYTVNMSCDITDIGRFSTTPALLKLQGFSSNFFTPDGLKINVDLPLENLPNIDIQNKTITVKPLWSQNTDNINVGINRLDFELIKKIEPFVTVIGNQFTDKYEQYWTYNTVSTCNDGNSPEYICLGSKTKGNLKTKIFTIKNTVPDSDCDLINIGRDRTIKKYDYDTDIELLPSFKYGEYQDGNGNFIYLIICNRNKVISDELGNLISVNDDDEKGVFTSFRGYFYLENDVDYGNVANKDRVGKIALKIPQLEDCEYEIPTEIDTINNIIISTKIEVLDRWIWKHYKFDFGKIYSVAQKLIVECSDISKNNEQTGNQTNILYIVEDESEFQKITNGGDTSTKRQNINEGVGGKYRNFYNHLKSANISDGVVIPSFKNQWMNFSIYFENFKYLTEDNTGYVSNFITKNFRLKDNDRPIGAKQKNTKWLANGTYIQTNFILIDKTDFIKFYEQKYNGITQLGFRIPKNELSPKGAYLRSEKPFENNSQYFNQDNSNVNEYYFLIGTNNNNIIQYLIDSKII